MSTKTENHNKTFKNVLEQNKNIAHGYYDAAELVKNGMLEKNINYLGSPIKTLYGFSLEIALKMLYAYDNRSSISSYDDLLKVLKKERHDVKKIFHKLSNATKAKLQESYKKINSDSTEDIAVAIGSLADFIKVRYRYETSEKESKIIAKQLSDSLCEDSGENECYYLPFAPIYPVTDISKDPALCEAVLEVLDSDFVTIVDSFTKKDEIDEQS